MEEFLGARLSPDLPSTTIGAPHGGSGGVQRRDWLACELAGFSPVNRGDQNCTDRPMDGAGTPRRRHGVTAALATDRIVDRSCGGLSTLSTSPDVNTPIGQEAAEPVGRRRAPDCSLR